jgi:uncharacterized protein YjbI with pentapeptide repeats
LSQALRAEFVKAVVESNEFDAPGYDRIAISEAVIDGDLNLAKITINNALQLENAEFRGSVDFSYSSTKHNLDISGTLRESKVLCLKGFQTDASVFIYNVRYQHANEPAQKSPYFCTDTTESPSIGLQGARIGGELNIRNTAARWVDAQGAQITGQVIIQNSTMSRGIDFSGATAGGFSFLQVKSPAELKKCDSPSVFLEGTDVHGSADFVQSDFCGISMTGAHIAKNVDLLGSWLAFFDFSGSNAEGDLQIGPSRESGGRLPKWLPPFGNPLANLVLSHSSVTLVRVALNNWPNICNIPLKPEQKKFCVPSRAILKSIIARHGRTSCRISRITLPASVNFLN